MTNSKLLNTELPVVHLMAGEIFVSDKPTLVTTVLGSCVSITMFDKYTQTGAICHGLLPKCHNDCENCPEKFKYVDCSIKFMLESFNKKGIELKHIEVKLFGGGDVLSLLEKTCKNGSVGKQNIKAAKDMLDSQNLIVLSSDTGGERGRRIFFYTHTGEVFLKRVRKTNICKK